MEKERMRQTKHRVTKDHLPEYSTSKVIFSRRGGKKSYLLVHTVIKGNTVLQQLPSA